MAIVVDLKNVRMSFPDIFTPGKFDENSEPKYGATFLIQKGNPQTAVINAAIKKAATEEWGGKADAVLKTLENNNLKYCFTDGDVKDYDGYASHWALTTKSSVRPFVCDLDKSPLTADDGRPYGGCYVNARVEIYAQDNKWGKGMRASLKGVQFYRDGPAFAGGVPATADDFEDLSNTGEEELA